MLDVRPLLLCRLLLLLLPNLDLASLNVVTPGVVLVDLRDRPWLHWHRLARDYASVVMRTTMARVIPISVMIPIMMFDLFDLSGRYPPMVSPFLLTLVPTIWVMIPVVIVVAIRVVDPMIVAVMVAPFAVGSAQRD